jgi:hypothetical protein
MFVEEHSRYACVIFHGEWWIAAMHPGSSHTVHSLTTYYPKCFSLSVFFLHPVRSRCLSSAQSLQISSVCVLPLMWETTLHTVQKIVYFNLHNFGQQMGGQDSEQHSSKHSVYLVNLFFSRMQVRFISIISWYSDSTTFSDIVFLLVYITFILFYFTKLSPEWCVIYGQQVRTWTTGFVSNIKVARYNIISFTLT